jgi:hypothetical protein
VDHRFKVKHKIKQKLIKILEENLFELGIRKNIVNKKEKINWTFKIMNCYTKTLLENDKISQRLGKIFINFISDKGLISRIYSDFSNVIGIQYFNKY